MSDSNATELLRRLLDERGVEWKAGLDGVTWVGDWCFVEYENGKLAATCEPVLTPEQAIAATLGSEFNPDGLPAGLTISDDSNLLNWRGENYVKQSTLGGGTLTAEQVREIVDRHWHDLPADYDMPEAAALPEYSYDWQVIADELNAVTGADAESRWHELFGTPERAARTLAKACVECDEDLPCCECPLYPIVGSNVYEPEILEWLKGRNE